ncbi:Hypothetical protein R9X50_00629200 [Acrodontium crateriforme]|uniref:Cytochrome b561 domain-containing protein n=1 Tax=Acrodontium crateriforme TaxID=150365 RepID=A0AAQ3M9C9_9PEZI|nr:Hypothetical protein R9X50_00629200 [Acrodontium crateriforme]
MRFVKLLSLTTFAVVANAQLDNTGNALDADVKSDHRRFLHGAFMCLAFLIVFPFGAVSRRCLKNSSVHAIAQIVGLVLAIAGASVGIACTVRDKNGHFSAPHQIIGFLIIAALICQLILAITNRRIVKRTNSPTVVGKIHKFLGWGIILLGVVNGGVGLKFADETFLLAPYVGIVVALLVIFGSVLFCAICLRRRDASKSNEPDGYQQPQFGPGQSNGHPAPPPYAPYPYQGAQDVPLQPYAGPQNGIQRPTHSNGPYFAA